MGTLTAAQVEQYKTEGYVVARSAVTAAQLAALKSQIAAWIEESRARREIMARRRRGIIGSTSKRGIPRIDRG
jgi:hypothetical protein